MKTLDELDVGDFVAVLTRDPFPFVRATTQKSEVTRSTETTVIIAGFPGAFSRKTGVMRGYSRTRIRIYIEPWDDEKHPAMIADQEREMRRILTVNRLNKFRWNSLTNSQLTAVSALLADFEEKGS